MKWNARQISKRYAGVKITERERSALKRNLKCQGVEMRSGRMQREFNVRSGEYSFSGSNTMYFGKSLEVDYTVDNASKTITFGRASLMSSFQTSEMNVILLELDKLAVWTYIERDEVDLLIDPLLDCFGAAQINALISAAINGRAVNCTARLLEYKNTRSPECFSDDDLDLG